MEAKRYIEGPNPAQRSFAPERLDEIIEEDNPVRFIRVYVESLNLFAMGLPAQSPRTQAGQAFTRRRC